MLISESWSSKVNKTDLLFIICLCLSFQMFSEGRGDI